MPCAGAGDDETPALAGTLSFSTHYSPAARWQTTVAGAMAAQEKEKEKRGDDGYWNFNRKNNNNNITDTQSIQWSGKW